MPTITIKSPDGEARTVLVEGRHAKKLAKRVYIALVAGHDLPLEYLRVTMCERFGWPLREFDSLAIEDVGQILAIWDAQDKAHRSKDNRHGG